MQRSFRNLFLLLNPKFQIWEGNFYKKMEQFWEKTVWNRNFDFSECYNFACKNICACLLMQREELSTTRLTYWNQNLRSDFRCHPFLLSRKSNCLKKRSKRHNYYFPRVITFLLKALGSPVKPFEHHISLNFEWNQNQRIEKVVFEKRQKNSKNVSKSKNWLFREP